MLVFVNNARPQYAQNLLNSAALPMGAIHTFRYAMKWVEPSLRLKWEENGLVGRLVWIVFHELASGSRELTPVRRARVVHSEFAGLLGILEVAVDAFSGDGSVAGLVPGFDEAAYWTQPAREQFSVLDVAVLPVRLQADDVHSWQLVAGRLAIRETYRSSSFVFVEGIREIGGNWYPHAKNTYRLSGSNSAEIVIHSLSPSTAVDGGTYELRTDPDVLIVSPTPELRLGFKFNRFAQRLLVVDPSRRSTAILDLEPDHDGVSPTVRLLVETSPTLGGRITAYLLPGASAVIAALAGVLPTEAPLELRLAMVALGSLGLAVATGRRR